MFPLKFFLSSVLFLLIPASLFAGHDFYETDLPHFEGDSIRHLRRLDRWGSLAVRGEIDAEEFKSLNSGLLALIRVEYQFHKKDGSADRYETDIIASGILERIKSTGVDVSEGLEVSQKPKEPIELTILQRIKDYKALREDVSIGDDEYHALIKSLGSTVRIAFLASKAQGEGDKFLDTLKENGSLQALSIEGVNTSSLFDIGMPSPKSFVENTRLSLLEYDLLFKEGKITSEERLSLLQGRFRLVQMHRLVLKKKSSIRDFLNKLDAEGVLDVFREAGLNVATLHRPIHIELHPPTFERLEE
jgi:hypothetical protein